MGPGLLSFIPYVGTIIGGVLAIGMALIQFWPDWVQIVIIVAIFVAGQFIEGNFLSPYLVGNRIGLHPVWLMFALFAFGYLFGFVGLLLAVPLAAAVGVLVRFALQQYLKSPLYLGVPTRGKAAPAQAPEPVQIMAGEGRQLAFDLPHRPASGRDDFLVTPSNAKAVALIDLWPNWPSNTLILLGPAGQRQIPSRRRLARDDRGRGHRQPVRHSEERGAAPPREGRLGDRGCARARRWTSRLSSICSISPASRRPMS